MDTFFNYLPLGLSVLCLVNAWLEWNIERLKKKLRKLEEMERSIRK